MFTAEVYADILRHLSRDDLDAVQLVHRYSLNIAKRNFGDKAQTEDKGPLRPLNRLYVRNEGGYSIIRAHGDDFEEVVVYDETELSARINFSTITCLEFGGFVTMDERLFNVFFPLRAAWRNAYCDVPDRFSSSAFCERTLNELLLGQGLHIHPYCELTLKHLMSTVAVQQCRKLKLDPDFNLDTNKVLAWLHRAKKWTEPTSLTLMFARNVDMTLLLTTLKDVFADATEPQKYEIEFIVASEYDVEDQVHHNYDTSERLRIYRDYCTILVKREPDADA
ncbi:hypothetical protein AAVH_20387 [Aphelenchoides avenae]|nr:hypothetical protein AAVH_20387 [Aphelenchus avenae]